MTATKESKPLTDFKTKFNKPINILIKRAAPRVELVSKDIPSEPDEKEDTPSEHEPERKEDSPSRHENISEVETKGEAPLLIAETTELKEQAPSEPVFSSLMEDQKAAAEAKDYQDFIKIINELKTNIFNGYEQAIKNEDTSTEEYLNNFANQMEKTVDLIKNRNVTRKRKEDAIYALILAASPSPEISKRAEPVISWIFYLLGGFIGLILGAIRGALIGGLGGIAAALYLAAQWNIFDINIILGGAAILGGLGAIVGAFGGAEKGATEISKRLYSLSHTTLFKPSEIRTQVEKGFKELKTIQRWFGRQNIERQIRICLPHEKLPEPMLSIVTEFANVDDKDRNCMRSN